MRATAAEEERAEREWAQVENRLEVEALLRHLADDRMRDIVRSYYGIGQSRQTLIQLSTYWGVSIERIRQIIKKAIWLMLTRVYRSPASRIYLQRDKFFLV